MMNWIGNLIVVAALIVVFVVVGYWLSPWSDESKGRLLLDINLKAQKIMTDREAYYWENKYAEQMGEPIPYREDTFLRLAEEFELLRVKLRKGAK